MYINLLWLMWLLYTFGVTITGVYVLYFPNIVPAALVTAFKYGKAAETFKKSALFKYMEIPKRWFSHFYIFASIFQTCMLWVLWQTYYYGKPLPQLTSFLLNSLASPYRHATITPEATVIAMILLAIQIYRRCYECLFVSVFSNVKINILHYIVGMTFYLGVSLSILAEAPGFDTPFSGAKVNFRNSWLAWNHIIGTVVYLWAFYVEYSSLVILANLRKDSNGKTVMWKHVIPTGGWFEVVSCPHYFSEIIMYLAVSLIFKGNNFTWWLVCLWTASSQILAGIMCHHWYKENFKDYPKSRSAVIPYVL